jgi:hypothetical protein
MRTVPCPGGFSRVTRKWPSHSLRSFDFDTLKSCSRHIDLSLCARFEDFGD